MTRQVLTQSIVNKINNQRRLTGQAPAVPDEYKDRLLKLIPAEVVSVYLAVFQLLTNRVLPDGIFWAVFVLLLLGNILYKFRMGVTDWVEFLISSVAFTIWVFSIGGPVPGITIDGAKTQDIAAVVVPIFTFFVPLLYK